jgi:predicted amidohydrolase
MGAALRIALGQFGAALGDVHGNLARVRESLERSAREGAALACFPELALSGYLLQRADYDDRLLDAVEEAGTALAQDAARLGLDVVYGAPMRGAAGLINAVVLQRASGGRMVYAKTHMDVKERRVFARGDAFPVDPDGVVGLACCYDLAFPEAIRAISLGGARVLLVPMAWEVERGFVMRHVAAARAVENVAYLVCVNQCGTVGDFRFMGASRVVDPLGETVLDLGADEELAIADLDVGMIDRLRDAGDGRTYPLLSDRRPELYAELARQSEPTPLAT